MLIIFLKKSSICENLRMKMDKETNKRKKKKKQGLLTIKQEQYQENPQGHIASHVNCKHFTNKYSISMRKSKKI